MPRLNRKKDRKELFIMIENAYQAARQMGDEGVLMITFNHGAPSTYIYNPGRSPQNKRGIEMFLKNNGV